MSYDELMKRVREIRDSRTGYVSAMQKKKKEKTKASAEAKVTKLLDQLSPEEIAELIKKEGIET